MSVASPPGPDDTPPQGVPAVGTAGGPEDHGTAPPADRVAATEGGEGSRAARVGTGHGPPEDGDGAGGADGEREPSPAPEDHRGRGGSHRRRRERRPLRRRPVLLSLLALLLVLVGAVAWFELEARPFGPEGTEVVVDVKADEGTSGVASQLVRQGVIGSALAFRLWSVLHSEPTIEPGQYLMRRNEPFAGVGATLANGPDVYEVDVEPGETVTEVATALVAVPGDLARSFLSAARNGTVGSPYQPAAGATLEGLLGAGQYQVRPGETADQLLSKMVARFDADATEAGLSPSTSVDGLTAYQVVTVASIAQKEGYFDRYLGDVARVVYNRLAAGMALDMTSTVLYSLGQDGGTVTPAEEQDTTPYNTYLHTGLTPTPICVPSEAGLAAAVSPPPGTWLYFDLVTGKKGVMVFSSTYTGQVAAEQQAAANATTGKGHAGATTTTGAT